MIPTPAPAARRRTTARALALTLAAGAAVLGTVSPAAAAQTPRVELPSTPVTVDVPVTLTVVCAEADFLLGEMEWLTSDGEGRTEPHGQYVGGDETRYTVTTTFTTPGDRTIKVTCRDGFGAGTQSKTFPVEVVSPSLPATTTTASVSSARVDPSHPVTFSAEVSVDTDVTPRGSVWFSVDGTPWGSASTDGTTPATLTAPPGTFAAGRHTLTATFTGEGLKESTSTLVEFYVKHVPVVELALPSHPRAGLMTLTATVPVTPDMPLPTGDVQFRWSEGAVLGTAPLDSHGVASLEVDLTEGRYDDVVAVYQGDKSFSDGSSARGTLVVEPAEQPHPTPVVTVALPTSPAAGPLTATVSVAAPTSDGVVPEGGVQLIVLDADRQLVHSTTGVLAGGSAKVTTPALPAGTYTVLAHYSGSSAQGVYREADSNEHALTVTAAPVTPVVPVVSAPSTVTTTVGTPARLTVSLPTHHRPTGDVVVRTSGAGDVLLTAAIPPTGDLVLSLPVLAPGTHELLIGTLGDEHVAAWGQALVVTVTGEPARGSALPDAQLAGSTTTVPASGQITLVARDFEPGETVVFYLHSEPVLLGTAVADAAVFGIPCERFGEQVCAWIRPKAPIEADEVLAWCKERISHHKVPARIRIVEEFPMTVTGKIQKFAMRDAEKAAVTENA